MALRKRPLRRGMALVIFLLYIAGLLKAVLFKLPLAQVMPVISVEGLRTRLMLSVNLVPLKTIGLYLGGSHSLPVALANLAGNLVLFVPLGFLLPFLLPQMSTFRRIAALSLLVSLVLEGLQLLLGLGSFDVDDLLLNLMGGVVGWLLKTLLVADREHTARLSG